MESLYIYSIRLIDFIIIITPLTYAFLEWKFSDKRTKKFHRTRKFVIVVGFVFAILGSFVKPSLAEKIDIFEKGKYKPVVNFEFIESENQLTVKLRASEINQVPIEDLYLKIDIPGKFQTGSVAEKKRIDKCEVSSSHLVSINNEVVAETVHLHYKNISPEGYSSININFIPTLEKYLPGVELIRDSTIRKNYIEMPFMDLHDFTRITYYWQFNGNNVLEENFINLEEILDYIKKDNLILKKEQTILRRKPCSEEWVEKYEWDRRNW